MSDITVPFYIYEQLLDKRHEEMKGCWGNDKTAYLYPILKQYIEDCPPAPEDSDPMAIVDNFLINGECIDKEEEFSEDGEYSCYFKKYNGDWHRLLKDALFGDEKMACMRF